MPDRLRVLILCTANSARSQMAEGLLRNLGGLRVSVHSAGLAPSSLHPLAIRAMDEINVDIRAQRSQHVNEFLREPFDTVITVCDHAAQNCPHFPLAAGARPGHMQRIHWSLPDPAAEQGSEEQRLIAFGRVRDELGLAAPGWHRRPSGLPRARRTRPSAARLAGTGGRCHRPAR